MARLYPVMIVCSWGLLVAGCTFFESSSAEEEAQEASVVSREAFLPNTAPSVRGQGPVVPGTAGLRVTSGYFSRARMGAVDLYLGYTMASFLRGEETAYLRLEAHGDKIGPSQTVFHAFLPVSVALDDSMDTLTKLTLEGKALAGAKANIRVATRSKRHNRLVELHRVTFDTVQGDVLTGTLEGTTKRGSRATSSLPFQLGFIAYRGPDVGMVGPPRDASEPSESTNASRR